LTILKDVVTTHTIFRGVKFTVLQLGIDYIGRWNECDHTKIQHSALNLVKIDLYLTAPAKAAQLEICQNFGQFLISAQVVIKKSTAQTAC
jgi:hypothetical protein